MPFLDALVFGKVRELDDERVFWLELRGGVALGAELTHVVRAEQAVDEAERLARLLWKVSAFGVPVAQDGVHADGLRVIAV